MFILLLVGTIATGVFAKVNDTLFDPVWVEKDDNNNYVPAGKYQEIFNKNSAAFETGYFGSLVSSNIHLTVQVNNKDGQFVSTVVSKNVNTAGGLGYERITIDPSHYKTSGEYIIVVKLDDGTANGESVDASLVLKVKNNLVVDSDGPGVIIPLDRNHAPEMGEMQKNKAIDEGKFITFTVSANDEDNDDLIYEVVGLREDLGMYFQPTTTQYGREIGVFSWRPGYDFVDHPHSIKKIPLHFRAYDGEDYSEWKDVTIIVNDVNRRPIFRPVADQTINENQQLKIPLFGVDADEDELEYSLEGNAPPSAQIIEKNKYNAELRWKPDYNAAARSPYRVSVMVEDGFGGQYSQYLTITVNDVAVTEGLTARDILTETDEDEAVTIAMSCSGNERELNYVINENPAHGSISRVYGNKAVYAPNANYNGEDSFTYYCTDNAGRRSNEANVYIIVNPVNDAPVTVNDGSETLENESVLIPVLSNDYDVDGDELTVSVVSLAENGVAVIEGNEVRYTPYEGFVGIDQFKYTVSDDKTETTGFVSVTVSENTDNEEEEEEPTYQCSDGLDNDNDNYTDYGDGTTNDPGCDSLEDDDEQDDGDDDEDDGETDEETTRPHYHLKLQSVLLAQELLNPGEVLFIKVRAFNNGSADLDELKVQAKIYDLGAWGSTGEFTLAVGQGTSKNVYVLIPEDALSGLYLVKVTIGNSHYHTSAYRLVIVSDSWNTIG